MDGIRALLLDIDGTVLDTREFIFQAAEHAIAANGYPAVPRERIAQAVGGSFESFYGFLLERDDIDVLGLQTAHRVFQLENIQLSEEFPGAKETLLELKRRGYRLAAITNRGRHSIDLTLKHNNMEDTFELVLCPEDVPELKPSPVPLQIALAKFALTPSEAVMVGDADMDIAAGKSAGTKTVRATYGFHFDSEHPLVADFHISDIRELLNLFP